jgi:hypothetical protein
MNRLRILAPCLVLGLGLAPGRAFAQDARPAPDIDARVAALESAVAALQRTVAALRASLNTDASERRDAAPGGQAAVESETGAAIAAVQSVLTPFVWFASDVFDGDLVGTYSVLMLGASSDTPPNRSTSYLFKGGATIREGGTGTMTLSVGGPAVQAAPAAEPAGGATAAATIDLTWALDSVTQTVRVRPAAVLGDFELFVAAGAQTLIGARSSASTHQLYLFTRQP